MKTVQSLGEIIDDIDNIDHVEQEIKVQLEGCTSIYELTIERDEGGLISDIPELKQWGYCDSEDSIIKEIFSNGNCMFEFDEQAYYSNSKEQNTTIINKGDIDIYHLSDKDIEFLRKIGDDETILLSWKIIENRIYLKDEDE